MSKSGWRDFETLESYIALEQRMYPHSRGAFSALLRRLGVGSKIVGSKVQKAGLLNVLGAQGSMNVQGEHQMKLDVISHDIVMATLKWLPFVAGLASEEEEEVLTFPRAQDSEKDRYIVLFDPLDGSSNIDANVSVGTIFSIHRCECSEDQVSVEEFYKRGSEQVAAGYVIYGSATMFVYTTGHGVHGFTLDPEVGEYILSHENMKIPDRCKCFSANDANYSKWNEPSQQFADLLRYGKGENDRYAKTTSRYIGSAVADFHRNLLYGGVFMYPADSTNPNGKLRLLYECAPLAMLAEQAGGKATTGTQRVLDVLPTELHQRVPFIVGNTQEIDLYEKMNREAEQSTG